MTMTSGRDSSAVLTASTPSAACPPTSNAPDDANRSRRRDPQRGDGGYHGRRPVSDGSCFGQSSYTVAESDDVGTAHVVEHKVEVTVTLSADPERTVVIPIEADGGGRSDCNADYSGVPESVTFNSGETSKSFAFTAETDNVDDARAASQCYARQRRLLVCTSLRVKYTASFAAILDRNMYVLCIYRYLFMYKELIHECQKRSPKLNLKCVQTNLDSSRGWRHDTYQRDMLAISLIKVIIENSSMPL